MPENIIQIDQHMLETRLDRLVTQKVTEILNAMLDAEADEIAGASRYERPAAGRRTAPTITNAGSPPRPARSS